jgi:hypothetical protein
VTAVRLSVAIRTACGWIRRDGVPDEQGRNVFGVLMPERHRAPNSTKAASAVRHSSDGRALSSRTLATNSSAYVKARTGPRPNMALGNRHGMGVSTPLSLTRRHRQLCRSAWRREATVPGEITPSELPVGECRRHEAGSTR